MTLSGTPPVYLDYNATTPLDKSVAEIRRGVLALNGQMCTCISLILVQNSVYDSARQRLKEAFTSVKIGDASAAGTELGPIIDRANQQRLAGIIERAANQAQMVIHGGVGEGERPVARTAGSRRPSGRGRRAHGCKRRPLGEGAAAVVYWIASAE